MMCSADCFGVLKEHEKECALYHVSGTEMLLAYIDWKNDAVYWCRCYPLGQFRDLNFVCYGRAYKVELHHNIGRHLVTWFNAANGMVLTSCLDYKGYIDIDSHRRAA